MRRLCETHQRRGAKAGRPRQVFDHHTHRNQQTHNEPQLARQSDEARQQERSQFLAALARGPLTRDELGACGVALAYERVRALAEPLLADRPLDEDIRRVRGTLEDTSFVRGLNEELGKLGPATMRKRGARRAGRGGGAGRGEAPFPQVAPQRHLRPIRPLRSER